MKKLKFTGTSLRRNWFTKHHFGCGEGSIKPERKTKAVKKQFCEQCGTWFGGIDEEKPVGMMITTTGNVVICSECSHRYADEQGVEDRTEELTLKGKNREDLITKITEMSRYTPDGLDNKKIEELEVLFERLDKERIEHERIEAITFTEDELVIEQYLIDDYDVIQNTNYLKCEEQIESYFKNDVSEYFDCGQGYYDESVEKIIKIGLKYYDVCITAEIGSAKQDRGDRLYWVEGIESVTYEEIDKPSPIERENDIQITLKGLSDGELSHIKSFLKSNYNDKHTINEYKV